jgi:membrane dipeptidase
MSDWFGDNRDFGNIAEGLKNRGMNEAEVAGIMGGNWMRFYADSFGPESAG